jgi:hypothetical protein
MKNKNTRLNEALFMPPLRHSTTEPFDIMKSEAVDWMCRQPVIRNYLFSVASRYGLIVFNKSTGTWQGRDWKGYTF